jgi:hypothetical protein
MIVSVGWRTSDWQLVDDPADDHPGRGPRPARDDLAQRDQRADQVHVRLDRLENLRLQQQPVQLQALHRVLLDNPDDGAGEVGPDVTQPADYRRRGGAEPSAAIPAARPAAAYVVDRGQRRVDRGLLAGQADAGAVGGCSAGVRAAEHEPPAAQPLVGRPVLRHRALPEYGGAASGPGSPRARRAAAAVTDIADPALPVEAAPAATYVSAVIAGAQVTVCWAGDSRAYWLPADAEAAAQLLTRDDSWAEELIAEGVPEAEAQASPQAHQITRWLGTDGRTQEPRVVRFAPAGDGVILLCSDGLWNYQPEPADLAALALPTALTDPLAAATELVTFALEAGGQDNITVVLAGFPWPPAVHPSNPGSTPT